VGKRLDEEERWGNSAQIPLCFEPFGDEDVGFATRISIISISISISVIMVLDVAGSWFHDMVMLSDE
jgi:hypothetical protein